MEHDQCHGYPNGRFSLCAVQESQGDEERFLQALNVIGSDTPQYLTGYEFV